VKKTKSIWSRPGFLIRRLHQIHVAIFLKECAEEQTTPIQWGILTIVSANPGVGLAEIGEELGLDRNNVANVVARLVRRGLLRQVTNKRDRRKKSISITAAGRKLMQVFEAKAWRAQRKALSALTPKDRQIFMRLLLHLVEHNNELSRVPIRLED
jgi:DNA-binding MarR family transcriptional regulator